MRIPNWNLRRSERWTVEQMIGEQPDLKGLDAVRDFGLWRHLFWADDEVDIDGVVGPVSGFVTPPRAISVWPGTVKYVDAAALLGGATTIEPMSKLQACEAVVGRLRVEKAAINMIVEDGEGGLDVWLDPGCIWQRKKVVTTRCPGGRNDLTGRQYRVCWAHQETRRSWADDLDRERAA